MLNPRISFFTWSIAAACAVILIFMYLAGYPSDPFVPVRFGAVVPGLVRGGEYFRLFTSVFVHFGFTHLAMNIGGLLIVGLRVEKYMGHIAFLVIFVLSGVVGSFCGLLFLNDNGYAAGASGAVFGLDGAALAYTYITKKPMENLTSQVMFMYILFGIAMGFSMEGVGNAAHVGGLAAGLVLGWIYGRLNKNEPR